MSAPTGTVRVRIRSSTSNILPLGTGAEVLTGTTPPSVVRTSVVTVRTGEVYSDTPYSSPRLQV